jgi:alpha-ketoglutarate-dependent taurine dioxygenase
MTLPQIKRRAVTVSHESQVRSRCFNPDDEFIYVIEPALKDVDLTTWASVNKRLIESQLYRHGAVLFRGFDVNSSRQFEAFVGAVSDQTMEYRERSSPRSQVGDKIYTSTDYPPDQKIFPHNEHSYSLTFPLKLFFHCDLPAAEGGETPLADTRRVLQSISPEIQARFAEKKWMYVRNFGDGFGLSWQTVYQTSDKSVVERYCLNSGIEFEWKEGDRLRTRQIREATLKHPHIGELTWFNHITFFHISTLEPNLRDAIMADFDEADYPNNTYYGDGSPIEPQVMDELREAYRRHLTFFAWQKGDIVLLDNMLTSHARSSYEGDRRVLFAMSEPFTRSDARGADVYATATKSSCT